MNIVHPLLTDLPTLLRETERIVHLAGDAIRIIYEKADFGITTKANDDPLTIADLHAEKIIREGLSALGDIPIISEETQPAPFAVRRDWPLVWLVDPLDGTKEFIARNGEFTVNVALTLEGRPILGVVHAPALDVTYWGAEGIGAFMRRDSQAPVSIHVREAQGLPVVAASRSHADAKLTNFLQSLGPHTVLPMGSSLKLCLVATGQAQLYPRLGPTHEWDTAAAQCVVEQAGGRVCDFEGNPLRYNKKDLLNPWFVCDPSRLIVCSAAGKHPTLASKQPAT